MLYYFRIRITDTLEYSFHTEGNLDAVATPDLPLETPVPQKEKPILMVKVENVLHEPFKLTEEVKVHVQTHLLFYFSLLMSYPN